MATIKAGTYRFNDVLTEPSADLEQSLHFSVHTYLPSISTECHFVCSEIGVCKSDVSCGFYVETASLDLSSVGFNFPRYVYTYGNGAWKSNLFGEGIKTITIPNDTEVSAEFLEWFTANTVQQKQIHGKWKFKDVIDYSGSGLDGYVNFDCNTVIDGFGNVLFRCSLIGVNEALPDGTPVRVAYMVESSTPDISSALGVTFPIPIAGLYRGEWDTSTYGEGIKTIDFGTEPQTVSAEFYEWLTANATQPTASITHNGEEIASLFPGQTATLKCAGMKMAGDVVVAVAEQEAVEAVEDYDGTITVTGEAIDENYDGTIIVE